MTFQRSNFHILSGGPGAGKTTTLEALRVRGFACVAESARQILKAQAAIGGNATHDGDQARYRDLTLARDIAQYEAAAGQTGPVFFDRAIPELTGYAIAPNEPPPAHILEAAIRYRYARRVFLFPAWEAIYTHDEERKHSFDHAMHVSRICAETYRARGYDVVEVPCVSIAERCDFILERIGAVSPRALPPGQS